MKKHVLLVIFLLILCFIVCGCKKRPDDIGSTNAVEPTSTKETQKETTTPSPEPTAAPTPRIFEQRTNHVRLTDMSMPLYYSYQSFIHIPVGVTYGPDGYMYICDWAGKHIVKMDKEGKLTDLELWKKNELLQHDGPRKVVFDSAGNMFFNNHGYIFKLNTNGELNELQGIMGSPVGGIAISSDDKLFYTDRGGGKVFMWTPEKKSELIADNLPMVEHLLFGLDGTLYITQMGKYDLKTLDIETGKAEIFAENVCQFDPCFLAVDKEGDIWVRAIWTLTQISPEGEIKPYKVYGQPWTNFSWHTSAGIAFDNEGNLLMASYNSKVILFMPKDPDASVLDFDTKVMHYGYEASDLAIDSKGIIYGTDLNSYEIKKTIGDNQLETVFKHGSGGRLAIAVDKNDLIYYSFDGGKIKKITQNGKIENYANGIQDVERMVFGADGVLYSIAGSNGQAKSIVAISGKNQKITIATFIDGKALGRNVDITPATNKGLYVLDKDTQNVYLMDFNGDGYKIGNLLDNGWYAQMMAACPVTGDIYFVANYNIIRMDSEGNIEHLGDEIYGDPWGMVVSHDGKELHIAESGAIVTIGIS